MFSPKMIDHHLKWHRGLWMPEFQVADWLRSEKPQHQRQLYRRFARCYWRCLTRPRSSDGFSSAVWRICDVQFDCGGRILTRARSIAHNDGALLGPRVSSSQPICMLLVLCSKFDLPLLQSFGMHSLPVLSQRPQALVHANEVQDGDEAWCI